MGGGGGGGGVKVSEYFTNALYVLYCSFCSLPGVGEGRG